MQKILPQIFYTQNSLKVAQDLLGKFLVRKVNNQILSGMITETEAYCGPNDLASHASKGKTPRTEIMFDQAGLTYIYLIYGMYYCFNIITEEKEYPAAVLIRSLKPVKGIETIKRLRKTNDLDNLTNGPGKLCQALNINKELNKNKIYQKDQIWIEDRGDVIKKSQIKKAKRIGIDYAKEYKDKLWRFYV